LTIVNQNAEYIQGSRVRLSITVSSADVDSKYQGLVKKYQKQLNIPGFRRGHVPVLVLEKKYGESLRAEVATDIIEDSLKQAVVGLERKALAYAQPDLDGEIDVVLGQDFSFVVLMDVEPSFEMGDYKQIESLQYDVKVSDADIAKEVERLRDQNAMVVPKEGAVANGDIVTVNYVELDANGQEQTQKKREGFVFTVGKDDTYYDFAKDVIGIPSGEEKVFVKKFADDYQYEDLAGKELTIKVKVVAIKDRQVPDLDDEFAQDVSADYKTLDDLRKGLQEKLQSNMADSAKNFRINSIIDQLVAKTEIDLPESMILAESDVRFRQFARQSGMQEEMLMQMLGGSREVILERWRPETVHAVKARLILQKLQSILQIQPSDDDIAAVKKRLLDQYNVPEEEFVKQLGEGQWQQYINEEAVENQLHAILLKDTKISESKTVTVDEFVHETQHNHDHDHD
jgi:trigger factor